MFNRNMKTVNQVKKKKKKRETTFCLILISVIFLANLVESYQVCQQKNVILFFFF